MTALGQGRFEVREQLGRGAFGDVYRVFDRERGVELALKRPHRVEPRALQRFKHAFRSLAELRQENIVALYELLSDGERWLITMELVPGVDLGSWAGVDPVRWRSALPQILRGLGALHEAGHLHRDLSLSNVRVTPEGRVVLLDFGLLGRVGEGGELVGGLHAIPPEMLERRPLGPAADWYALGALLYESLGGAPPFAGRSAEVIAQKLGHAPPPLRERAPNAPADLAALADGLLARDPSSRLEALAVAGLAPASVERAAPFVGRRPELARLAEALARAQAGARVHVRLRGASGMGKTALADRFAQSVPGALRGRCFEHEAVPFAGLDAVVDQLTATEISSRVDDEDGAALATLFPVLRQAWPSSGPAPDPAEAFGRAGRALARLATLRAGDAPPVLVLDDMQWGDEDGARLLSRLGAGRALVVTVQRSGERLGRFLTELDAEWPPDVELELGPLDAASIAELAAPSAVERLLAETDGKPLLLQEALRGGEARSIPEAMRARIEALRPPERCLLVTLAAAARPLNRELALFATERQRADAGFDGLTGLRVARMLELRHTTSGVWLELSHPSLAEVGRAIGETPEVHAALDDAMEAFELDEPEAHGRHALAAGRPERARGAFERAAEQAMATLAFDRAARLWHSVLALSPAEPRAVEARLGESLSALGRGAEAAEAFDRALVGRTLALTDPETIELARRRAEQWLHAGRIRRGQEDLRKVLAAAGVPYPSPARALASIVGRQLWLRVRGTKLGATRGGPGDALRTDLCFSAGQALSSVDSVRGADYVLRSLSLALSAGDRRRTARSLAFVAAYAASAGPPGEERTRRAIAEAERHAQALDDPYVSGMIGAARCLSAFHLGSYRESLAFAIEIEDIFRRLPEAARERVTAQIYRAANLAMLGEWEAMEEARQVLMEDARARRDRFGSTNGGSGLMNAWWLVQDEPARARREAARAIAGWSGEGFHVQHFFDLVAQARIDLYLDEPGVAVGRLDAARPRLRRSLLWRTFFVRTQLADLEGRALVARAARAREPASDLRRARAIASRLRGGGGWTAPYADALEGACLALGGKRAGALDLLRRARAGYTRLEMRAHARALDRALGELGDPEERPPSPAVANERAFARVLAPVVVRVR